MAEEKQKDLPHDHENDEAEEENLGPNDYRGPIEPQDEAVQAAEEDAKKDIRTAP